MTVTIVDDYRRTYAEALRTIFEHLDLRRFHVFNMPAAACEALGLLEGYQRGELVLETKLLTR